MNHRQQIKSQTIIRLLDNDKKHIRKCVKKKKVIEMFSKP